MDFKNNSLHDHNATAVQMKFFKRQQKLLLLLLFVPKINKKILSIT